MRLVKMLCCAIALTAFLAPGARADEWNKKTFLTFSGPVQIPGATLAAGTYVFKLADLSGNRHVVQVFDKDEKHVYGTILAIPDQRLEPTDDPVVLFAERPAGTPQAIRAWFYPGDTFGDEFVYPKSQAVEIARATHQSVLSTDENANTSDNEAMKSAKVGRVDENGKMSDENETKTSPSATTTPAQQNNPATARQDNPAGVSAATTTTTTSTDAKLKNSSGRNARNRGNNARANTSQNPVRTSGQSTTAPTPDTTAQTNSGNRSQLPKTASNLTLFELLAGLSLAGAFGIRRIRARFVGAR